MRALQFSSRASHIALKRGLLQTPGSVGARVHTMDVVVAEAASPEIDEEERREGGEGGAGQEDAAREAALGHVDTSANEVSSEQAVVGLPVSAAGEGEHYAQVLENLARQIEENKALEREKFNGDASSLPPSQPPQQVKRVYTRSGYRSGGASSTLA